ncbi:MULTISPECIES: hypothetical protein [Streptomyces]|uniref:Uncharacterized protein n=1 Tax=Streptomyces fungicidicus TaxID=68203 RepID=A0ACC7Y0F3_9ACTN|nr:MULTISPECIES: hypothetical protein [Streptomyces]MBF4134333.1 hypothetical protein [Streptomyces albidoflavus]NUV75241.1 hypothetical protein [Streptomyces fungicidicus]
MTPHPDIHHLLHTQAVRTLRSAPAPEPSPCDPPATPRARLGWALVTLGLRLAIPPAARPVLR